MSTKWNIVKYLMWVLPITLCYVILAEMSCTLAWHPTTKERVTTDLYVIEYQMLNMLTSNPDCIPLTYVPDIESPSSKNVSLYDPWGMRYQYAITHKDDVVQMFVVSSGHDRTINTADDIWVQTICEYSNNDDVWNILTTDNGQGTSWYK